MRGLGQPIMLYADKAALENRTKVKLLSIRERELTLYTNNCRMVGTVSALMAGIAYSALVCHRPPLHTRHGRHQPCSNVAAFAATTVAHTQSRLPWLSVRRSIQRWPTSRRARRYNSFCTSPA